MATPPELPVRIVGDHRLIRALNSKLRTGLDGLGVPDRRAKWAPYAVVAELFTTFDGIRGITPSGRRALGVDPADFPIDLIGDLSRCQSQPGFVGVARSHTGICFMKNLVAHMIPIFATGCALWLTWLGMLIQR